VGVVCDSTRTFEYEAVSQSQANASWLVVQLQRLPGQQLPDVIQVFRPQCLSLISAAVQQLGIALEPTLTLP